MQDYFKEVDIFSKIWRAAIVELWGLRGPHTEMNPQTITSPSNNHTFLKLHFQEGISYIWLVKWNLQASTLTTLSLSKIF